MLLHHTGVISVLFDSSIDTTDEDICGIEANGSCQKPKANDHDNCVAKIEKGWNKIHNAEL